jgi:UDP-N-acetylglucosamine--N-acetylmuramyl-(pentapeptide) pyrophosphoryl-undecaprenol N-acetylglucosamine transferase
MWEYALNEKENIVLSDYIYNMPIVMAAADIVICRAGAMTLSEIAVMKKASVIIPSPNVTDNHQYKNAKILADADAAILIEEKNISGEALTKEISRLIDSPEIRSSLEHNIAGFAMEDVGRTIYKEIQALISEK